MVLASPNQTVIEPPRSPDGFCGPQHNNAVCLGTDAQCCNSETWTCGNTDKDGTCYEGFCGNGVCQSGNCNWPWLNPTTTSVVPSSTVSSTPSSSSSSSNPPIPTPTDTCSDGTGDGGLGGLCSWACSHGFCPSPCTRIPGTPNTLPPPTGDRGYALLDLSTEPGFPALCDFVCSYAADYCPEQVCTKIPYSTVQNPGTVCVEGKGEGGHAGLCSYSCRYDHCPPEPCTCTLYGQAIQEPSILNTPGEPAPGIDDSYSSLCSYTCNHGYCPAEVCVYST